MNIYIVIKYYFTSGYKSTHFATASKDDAFKFFDKQEKNCSYYWIIEKWNEIECTIINKK